MNGQHSTAETEHYRRFREPYAAFHPIGYQRLIAAADLPRAGLILDLGGGSGAFGVALADEPARRVIVCDLSQDLLATGRAHWPRPNVEWLEADATKLPFADGSVDGIMLGSLLHHFQDFSAVARECWRVLKPGGWCVSADPNGNNWMMWLLRHPSSPLHTQAGRSDNERWLGAAQVRAVFGSTGFECANTLGVRGVPYRLATFCSQEENPPPSARVMLAGWNFLERTLALLPAGPFWLASWMVLRFRKPL